MRHLIVVLAVVLASPAWAVEYEVFVDVSDEDDIYALLEQGEISEDTRDSLLDLLDRGVSLQSAGRDELYELPNLTLSQADGIISYRKEAGRLSTPVDLIGAGVLTEEEVLAIAPFIIIEQIDAPTFATKGKVKYATQFLVGHTGVPPMRLTGKVKTFNHFEAGFTGLVRRIRPGSLYWNGSRHEAAPPRARPDLPKYYFKWDTKDWGAIAGTYTIGFGQRLTFDNTGRDRPNGFRADAKVTTDREVTSECRVSGDPAPRCPERNSNDPTRIGYDDLHAGDRTAPDYRTTARLHGIAGGIRDYELGGGSAQAFGFFSYARRALYQNELAERCTDPLGCTEASEAIFLPPEDGLLDQKHKWQTVPGVYNELLAGGNLGYDFTDRVSVGVTGYGSSIDFVPDGTGLDFRSSSRIPAGGPFGAVGINSNIRLAWTDVGVEVARTFDSAVGPGGGFGAIVRGIGSWGKRELETSVRYYDAGFANPYARPVSAADEFEGLRARDELGFRAKFVGPLWEKDARFRSTLDLWSEPSTGRVNTKVDARLTYQLSDAFRAATWGTFHDKDIAVKGTCFSGDEPLGGPTLERGCQGEKVTTAAEIRYTPTRALSFTLQYTHQWLSDRNFRFQPGQRRQDVNAVLIVTFKPTDSLTLRARGKYDADAVQYSDYEETKFWAYLKASQKLAGQYTVHLRYDTRIWLDDRSSTEFRDPSPEHWLSLEFEAKF